MVLALGLGLSVLAAVGQIDANLRGLVTRDLPARAPAYLLRRHPERPARRLPRARRAPRPASARSRPRRCCAASSPGSTAARRARSPGPHWALNGDRGVTYAADAAARAPCSPRAPGGRRTTPARRWSSFAAEEGRELGLKLGDALTVNVLGRDITATIASFREVRFEIDGHQLPDDPRSRRRWPARRTPTSPPSTPTPEAEAPLLRAVADAYPNVTAIGVREAIDRVAATLDGIGAATRWAAAATLVDRARGARSAPRRPASGAGSTRRRC